MNYFNRGIRGCYLGASRCRLSGEWGLQGNFLVNNARIVYTYIRCSRILGGQNTSASLRKILADALQATLPRDERNNEAGLKYLRSRWDNAHASRTVSPTLLPQFSSRYRDEVHDRRRKKWSPGVALRLPFVENISALGSKVGINRIKKLYTLFTIGALQRLPIVHLI